MGTQTISYRTSVILASAARGTSSTSAAFSVGTQDHLSVAIDATAVTGTSPSMTVSVEWSTDGTTWYVADPAEAFTAITATGKKVKRFQTKGLLARLNYAITGTSPSFTFSAHAVIGS